MVCLNISFRFFLDFDKVSNFTLHVLKWRQGGGSAWVVRAQRGGSSKCTLYAHKGGGGVKKGRNLAHVLCTQSLIALFLFRSVVEDVDWRCLLTFYTPVLALILVSLFFYWSSQRLMSKKLIYNRSMQHFQVNFDLFTKFLLVVGIWWLFHALAALLQRTALTYISMAFNIIIGPLVFLGK